MSVISQKNLPQCRISTTKDFVICQQLPEKIGGLKYPWTFWHPVVRAPWTIQAEIFRGPSGWVQVRIFLKPAWSVEMRPKNCQKSLKKCDFCRSWIRRPGSLLCPTLANLAEILKGCWRILWLCVVQLLARLVEVRPSYRPKTTKNW